jgi:NAD(P)-dependent dehydrogenase (short-subunit alcohol dehydrogenase family)
MSDVAGLRAIVTGAGSGIGSATAALLRDRGANVACLDLDPSTAPEGVHQVMCDVTDPGSVDAAVASAAATLGGIDILVNNAGIGAHGTVADNSDEEWHRVLDVNVVGVARVTRAALPWLRRSESPAIVNTCSIAATAGLPNRALYSASKGAVLSLTMAMAADHVAEGIRVNCVNPGTVDTPWVARLLEQADDPDAERVALSARQPTGRLVTAAEVAEAICFLAGRGVGAVTGATVAIDGGMQGLRVRR